MMAVSSVIVGLADKWRALVRGGGNVPLPRKEPPIAAQKMAKMDWPAILAELHRRGMTMSELARRNGYSIQSASRLRNTPNFPVQQAVADFLGCAPEDLWPDRYPKGGPRILDRAKYPLVADEKKPVSTEKRGTA